MTRTILCVLLAGCYPHDGRKNHDDSAYQADADTDADADADTDADRDADGDGYAAAADCDDADASVNPGASEVCDGADNNCDGAIDEGLATLWYADADGDGYGDGTQPTEACTAPEGAVADGTDCDDAAASANPGAEEVCGNGIDDDCDGEVPPGCRYDGDVDLGSMATVFLGGSTDSVSTWVGAGDMDGDGRGDVAIGSSWYGSGGRGGVAIHLAPFAAGQVAFGTADALLTGASASDQVGAYLMGAGDLNGDGLDDLLASGGGTGEFIVFGRFASGARVLGTGDDAAIGLDGGASAASAGDVDGDGSVDIAFGFPRLGGNYASAALFTGPFDLGGSYGREAASVTWDGSGRCDVSAHPGDLNADGFSDLLLSCWYNALYPDDAYGRVFYGPVAGAVDPDDDDVTVSGIHFAAQTLATVVSGSDFDGDGVEDLLVGSSGDDAVGIESGLAAIFLGGSLLSVTPLSSASATLYGSGAYEGAGEFVDLQDCDGDGRTDLLVGGFGGTTYAGISYLVYGPVSGTAALPDVGAAFAGESASDQTSQVRALGDATGDGVSDYLVGGIGVGSLGAAYLVPGRGW